MELYLACLKIGVIPCPLDARGTLQDQAGQLALVNPRGLAFHAGQAGRAEVLRPGLPPDALWLTLGPQGLAGGRSLEDAAKGAADREPAVRVKEEDVAFILFTGGTTGASKGVMLTHRNLIWNAINVIAENRSPGPEAVVCYPMQIYHSGALSRFLATLFAGGSFLAMAGFDPEAYLDALQDQGGTFVAGNQAIWHLLLEAQRKKPRNLASVSSWLHAQGDLSPEMYGRIRAELFSRGEMYASYALTEAGPGVTVLKPWDRPRQWPGIGRPYITQQVRLVDEQGQEVETGQSGEILVRGPNVMKGYFADPQATDQALADGWLHTGDLVSMDDRGYLSFTGRIKDMIKSGGLNVHAVEVEKVLLSHPGVAEAAVIGVRHPKWGETVRAIVVRRPGSRLDEPELLTHCRERLASYKKPTSVIFVPELPKGSFGSKVLKRQLRRMHGGEHATSGDKGGTDG